MAFIRLNFSPVGSQSRRGASPQVFSYATADDALAAVKGSGYFPQDPGDQPNSMLGVFAPNDFINVSATDGFAIFSVLNDGSDGNAITMKTEQIVSA